MKKSILVLACVAIVPLAFAQTTTTEETVTKKGLLGSKTETTVTTTTDEGTVTTFTPGSRLVVKRVGVTEPVTYTLGKTVEYVDATGKVIDVKLIKPGARVHVYYDKDGNAEVVHRVVVDQ